MCWLVLLHTESLQASPRQSSTGGIALLMTFLPAVFERNYRFPLDPGLGLWITTAVFLHTLGLAGLYSQIAWWDHLTYSLSVILVAATGYTAARGIELHVEDVNIPQRFMSVYILVGVLA